MGDEQVDPRVYSIETQQTASGDPEYQTPFERAHDVFKQASTNADRAGASLKPHERAALQFQQAQFEMLSAIHEVLERVDANTRSSAADDAINLLLGQVGRKGDGS